MNNNICAQIIISEGAISGNGAPQIVGPQLSISLPFIPSTPSFFISLIAYLSEPIDSMRISLVVKPKHREEVIFEVLADNIELPHKESNLNFVMSAEARSVTVKEEGIYVVVANINGTEFTHEFVMKTKDE